MTEKEKIQLVAEVNILRNLRHPNIVRYYERFVDRSNCQIYIIMGWISLTKEYCEGGDLAGIIKRCRKEKQYIPEDVIWNLFAQLALALNECHKSKTHSAILHRKVNINVGTLSLKMYSWTNRWTLNWATLGCPDRSIQRKNLQKHMSVMFILIQEPLITCHRS